MVIFVVAGRVPPCRVTNEGTEMLYKDIDENPEFIDVSQIQIPFPEDGPLERRVLPNVTQASEATDISREDEEYWFTEPPGQCTG